MMQRKKTELNSRSCLLITGFAWFGIIGNNISYRLGGVAYFSVSLIMMLLAILPSIAVSKNGEKIFGAIKGLILFSILYMIGAAVLLKTGHSTTLMGVDIPVQVYNMILNIPVWVSCGVLVIRTGVEEKKKVLDALFVFFVFNILVTYSALLVQSDFVKEETAGIIDESMLTYKYLGAMGYEFTYSLAILIPLFFWLGKRLGKKWFALGILCVLFVIKCEYLIALVVLAFNVGLYFCWGIKKKSIKLFSVILVCVLTIAFFLYSEQIGEFLILFSRDIGSTNLRLRVLQVGRMLAFGDTTGDALYRFVLYKQSIDAIIKHPICGILVFDHMYELSDHSDILDTWGGYGIIPLLVFIGCIRKVYVYIKNELYELGEYRIFISAFATFIFVALVNPIFAGPQIMLVVLMILPIVAVVVAEEERKSHKTIASEEKYESIMGVQLRSKNSSKRRKNTI